MQICADKLLNESPAGYLEALDDFGILDLMQKLSEQGGSDFGLDQLSSLATLLVKHLTAVVSPEVVHTYRDLTAAGRDMLAGQLLAAAGRMRVPADCPAAILDAQPPWFRVGELVQWIFADEPKLADWGIVVGRYYGYSVESGHWQWCYLVMLDPDAPSARWCGLDTAWECDLERYGDE